MIFRYILPWIIRKLLNKVLLNINRNHVSSRNNKSKHVEISVNYIPDNRREKKI